MKYYECRKLYRHAWLGFRQMETYIEKEFYTIEESDGIYLKDEKGRQLIDAISIMFNSCLGHRNYHIIHPMIEQMKQLDNMTALLSANEVSLKASQKICELTDDYYDSVFFTNSGSEATDTAIKIAVKYFRNKKMNRYKFISLRHAYHGCTLGAMSLAQDCFEGEDRLFLEGFYQVSVPDCTSKSVMEQHKTIHDCVEEVENILNEDDTIAAFYLELIQLSNGVCILPTDYVKRISQLCKEKGILLIVDEVATGFGRTGTMFASESYEVYGDIMTMGKGISAGYFPIAAVAVTKEVFNTFYELYNEDIKLEHGFTTGGHPVGCVAVLATLHEMETNNYVEKSRFLGEQLLLQLKNQCSSYSFVEEIRGKGLLVSINFYPMRIIFNNRKDSEVGISRIVYKMLLKKGVLVYADSDYNIVIAPPFVITEDEISLISKRIHEVFENLNELDGNAIKIFTV